MAAIVLARAAQPTRPPGHLARSRAQPAGCAGVPTQNVDADRRCDSG